jgi:hypothetical protein
VRKVSSRECRVIKMTLAFLLTERCGATRKITGGATSTATSNFIRISNIFISIMTGLQPGG